MKKFFAGCIAVSFAAMLAACGDDSSSTSPETIGNESSSSVEEVSSSSVIPSSSSEMPPDTACCKVMESSSSIALESSSSAVAPKSSSSSVIESSSSAKLIIGNMLWDGFSNRSEKVLTGGDETSGYWYEFNDNSEGGSSTIEFPSDVDTHIDGSPFSDLIEKYRGIQLGVAFGSGYEKPYAGVAFNVWSEEQEGVNVYPWGGLCLEYKSSIDFEIELGLENGAIPTMGSCSFVASVPASTSEKVSDFVWEKFKNNCGAGVSPDIMDVLKKVATVKLKFKGDAGTTGDFFIERIGVVGMCHDMMPAP
jgi:hypothetical protein